MQWPLEQALLARGCCWAVTPKKSDLPARLCAYSFPLSKGGRGPAGTLVRRAASLVEPPGQNRVLPPVPLGRGIITTAGTSRNVGSTPPGMGLKWVRRVGTFFLAGDACENPRDRQEGRPQGGVHSSWGLVGRGSPCGTRVPSHSSPRHI